MPKKRKRGSAHPQVSAGPGTVHAPPAGAAPSIPARPLPAIAGAIVGIYGGLAAAILVNLVGLVSALALGQPKIVKALRGEFPFPPFWEAIQKTAWHGWFLMAAPFAIVAVVIGRRLIRQHPTAPIGGQLETFGLLVLWALGLYYPLLLLAAANTAMGGEPETPNGFEDADGCPDKGRVIVKKGTIEILDKIYFETAKAVIRPISFPILDAVAETLKNVPAIQLVEIQGHADERGSHEYNDDLTDRRAAAVRQYLVDKGIDAGRLQSKGYGKRVPIDPRHNAAAWEKNRRVEFKILKRTDQPAGP